MRKAVAADVSKETRVKDVGSKNEEYIVFVIRRSGILSAETTMLAGLAGALPIAVRNEANTVMRKAVAGGSSSRGRKDSQRSTTNQRRCNGMSEAIDMESNCR